MDVFIYLVMLAIAAWDVTDIWLTSPLFLPIRDRLYECVTTHKICYGLLCRECFSFWVCVALLLIVALTGPWPIYVFGAHRLIVLACRMLPDSAHKTTSPVTATEEESIDERDDPPAGPQAGDGVPRQ